MQIIGGIFSLAMNILTSTPKSYNQNFNKKLAHCASIKSKQGIEKGTKGMTAMYDKRNRYIDTFMHTTSKAIVDMLVEQHIGKLVVGRNKGWKQEVNIGKTNMYVENSCISKVGQAHLQNGQNRKTNLLYQH